MRILTLALLLLFTGCQSEHFFPYPLHSEGSQPQALIDAALLREEDREQLARSFKAHGIEISSQLSSAPFFVKSIKTDGYYQDLYADSLQESINLSVDMTLELVIVEKHSGRVLLDRVFKHQERIIPNDDFYSHKNWYQAQVLYEGRQALYDQAAYEFSLALKGHDKNT